MKLLEKRAQNFKTVVSDIDKAKLIEVNGHNTEAIIEKLMEQPIEIREAVEEVSVEYSGFTKSFKKSFHVPRLLLTDFM